MKKKDMFFKNNSVSSVEAYINRVTKPIFKKVLKETSKNRMSVGGSVCKKPDISLYQPHNYRLYFDFFKGSFVPPLVGKTTLKGSVVTTDYEYKVKNSTEHFFKNFLDCNITVKKTQIEITNKIEHKRWYIIKHKNISDYTIQVKEILFKKDLEALNVLKSFINEFGGFSNFNILNRKSEDKVQLEDSVDKVGLKNHFHSATCKKVYNDSNVEFNDPVFTVNYFENRAIEKIAPEINKELSYIKMVINRREALSFLKDNVRCPADIIKFKNYVKLLSDFDIENFCEWTFNKLGSNSL